MYTNTETIKTTMNSGICKTIYYDGRYFFYVKRDNEKVSKLHINNSSYFKVSAFLF